MADLDASARGLGQLGEHPAHLVIDGGRRDAKPDGHLVVGAAGVHQIQKLLLVGRQAGGAGFSVDERVDDLRIHDGAAARYLADGVDQLLWFGDPFLEQVAEPGGSVLEQGERVLGVVVAR